MDKIEILNGIKKQLEINLDAALAEAQSAKEAATDTESKAENKYDTRGLEASYIAQAQGTRVLKIKEQIYNLSKVNLNKAKTSSIGSLLEVYYTLQERQAFYFLLPSGGTSVEINGIAVQSISIESPLGKLLFNKTCDDLVVFRKEEIEITKIY